MGNYTSKLFHKNNHDAKTKAESSSLLYSERSHFCTPVSYRRKARKDPRSITFGILRTPIEVNYIHNVQNKNFSIIPKYVEGADKIKQSYLETNMNFTQIIDMKYLTLGTLNMTNAKRPVLIHDIFKSNMENNNFINKSNLKVLYEKKKLMIDNLDPRSPGNDFERTPILKGNTIKQFISLP